MKRKYRDSHLFKKKLDKLKGQDLFNVLNKIEEILTIPDLDFYKNLKHDLKKFKRVHVNNSYVILFFGDDGSVNFVDYISHDKAYKHDKNTIKKYDKLDFQ